MKKLLAVLMVMFSVAWVHASPTIYKSSNTATVDTAQALCPNGKASRHGMVHSVCVNTGAAGTLTLWNAFGTGANPIAAVNTANAICLTYDVTTSSGLSYTNSATANVTIAYDCY